MPIFTEPVPRHRPLVRHPRRLAVAVALLLLSLGLGAALIVLERTGEYAANYGLVGILVIIATLAVSKDVVKGAL
jgi:hypothetical protein